MRDILIPSGNEKELISMAKKLGYTALWFVYKDEKKFYKGEFPVKNVLITKKSFREPKFMTAMETSLEDIRNAVEHIKPSFVFGIETSTHKDYIHQRGSGINHIIAKFAQKNKVNIAFDFSMLQKKTTRARMMGRLTQNIQICRKYKCNMLIGSFAKKPEDMRAPGDIGSLFTILGMHPSEVKKSMN